MPHSLGCCQQRHHQFHKFYLLLFHCIRSSHTYNLSDLLLYNDINHYIFYKIYRSFFPLGNPLANHLTNLFHGQQMMSHIFLIILLLLNVVEEFVRVFSSPSTTIFNSPIISLYLPISRNFIFHRERWYTPY